MPTREFSDDRQRTWIVREVQPSRAERRIAAGTGEPPHGVERRVRREVRTPLPARYAHGWLLFRTGGERTRRLAPVPAAWQDASAADLQAWCEMAERFGPPPRPILAARR